MSILIKGMEMPKYCGECRIKSAIYCERWRLVRSVSLDRHKDCPLVPVQPHGRLIDVDKVLDELAHNLGIRSLDYLTPNERAIVSWFRDAPTIIPAEEGEEQREYEAQVEAAQYCEMYEPSCDSETGAL